MGTSEILALISLILAFPAFADILWRACSYLKKKKTKIEITGTDIDKYNQFYLYIKVINISKNPFSITNIKINEKQVLVVDKTFHAPFSMFIGASDNKVYKILYTDIKENDAISIKLYTSIKEKPYKYDFPSIIEQIKTQTRR